MCLSGCFASPGSRWRKARQNRLRAIQGCVQASPVYFMLVCRMQHSGIPRWSLLAQRSKQPAEQDGTEIRLIIVGIPPFVPLEEGDDRVGERCHHDFVTDLDGPLGQDRGCQNGAAGSHPATAMAMTASTLQAKPSQMTGRVAP